MPAGEDHQVAGTLARENLVGAERKAVHEGLELGGHLHPVEREREPDGVGAHDLRHDGGGVVILGLLCGSGVGRNAEPADVDALDVGTRLACALGQGVGQELGVASLVGTAVQDDDVLGHGDSFPFWS